MKEANTRLLEIAFGNRDQDKEAQDLLPYDYIPATDPFFSRPYKKWIWTPIDEEELLSTAVEASRLRDGCRPEIVEHYCQMDDHREHKKMW